MQPLWIYGMGGMGRELLYLLDARGERRRVAGFIDDRATTDTREPKSGLPCAALTEAAARFPDAAVLLGVGCPIARRTMAHAVHAAGLVVGSAIDPTARVGRRAALGDGAVLCGGVFVTEDITIGCAVQINFGSVVGHDCVVGDFVTVAPSVVLCGGAVIEDDVWLGVGAKVLPNVRVGRGARVTAGAIVVRDVPPRMTAAGVPARTIQRVRHTLNTITVSVPEAGSSAPPLRL